VFSLRFSELATGAEWLRVQSTFPGEECISGDGTKLACLSTNREEPRIEIWDLGTRTREKVLGAGVPLILSYDGKRLLSRTNETFEFEEKQVLVFWDLERGGELGRLTIPDSSGPAAQFSPDGSILAINYYPVPRVGKVLKLFDVNTQREVLTLPIEEAFDFVLQGKAMVAVSVFQPVIYWLDVSTGTVEETPLHPPVGSTCINSMQVVADVQHGLRRYANHHEACAPAKLAALAAPLATSTRLVRASNLP
jgi:hypothetical protein